MGGYGSPLYGGGTFQQPDDWEDSINTAFRQVIKAALGMPDGTVRPANQNAPTGQLTNADNSVDQYITVLFTTIASEGEDQRKLIQNTDGSQVEVTEGQRLVTAMVQCYRGNAVAQMNRLHALFKTEPVRIAMQAQGLGLIKVHQVQNVTQVIDDYMEPRAAVDIEFYAIAAEIAPLQSYTEFHIKYELNNPSNPTNEVIKTP